MERTVIHIGLHKAASTYLQTRLFPALPAHYVFVAGYRRRVLDQVQSSAGFDPDVLHEYVRAEIARTYGRTTYPLTILSHEELSGHPHGHHRVDPAAVAANLKEAFPGAGIILVIRDQFAYLRSLYAFRVAIQGLETRTPEQFFREEGRLGLFDKLEYDRLVEVYTARFGTENLLVVPVELLRENPAAFNRAITGFLNLAPVAARQHPIVNPGTTLSGVTRFWRPLNAGVNALIAGLQALGIEPHEEYPYRRLRYSYFAVKRRLTPLLNHLLSATAQLSPRDLVCCNELFERYAQSNARLLRLAGIDIDLARYGYPLPGGNPKKNATW